MTHQQEGYCKCEDPLGEKRETAPYQAPLRWGACTGNRSPCDIWFENQQSLIVGAPRIRTSLQGSQRAAGNHDPARPGPAHYTASSESRPGGGSLKSTWVIHEGNLLTYFMACAGGAAFSPKQQCWREPFLLPSSSQRARCLSEPVLTVPIYLASTGAPP